MVVYAAQGCGIIFQSDLVKRDLLAKRRGRLPVQPVATRRFSHSRGPFPGGATSSTFGHNENSFLNTFLGATVSSQNVRIASLRTVRTVRQQDPERDDDAGLNFIWRMNDYDKDQVNSCRTGLGPQTPRSFCGSGSRTDRCWTASTSIVPRGAKAYDRREMAYIANMNSIVRPYKEQTAALFFRNKDNDADPSNRGRIFKKGPQQPEHGQNPEVSQRSAFPLPLPSRPFEECPEAWHVYAVQCFLSGDQVSQLSLSCGGRYATPFSDTSAIVILPFQCIPQLDDLRCSSRSEFWVVVKVMHSVIDVAGICCFPPIFFVL